MDGTGLFAGANTLDAISGAIWGDCPMEALRDKLVPGFFWRKEFNAIPGGAIPTTAGAFGDLELFSSTGGTAIKDTTEVGGGLKIGSDDDNEGVGLRQLPPPAKINLNNGDLWFEARILSSTIADTTTNIFLGLIEDVALTAVIPITAAGALADKNLVGFRRTETAAHGAKMDCSYKADGVTAVTVLADAVTLVAGTYTNLGMKFVPKRNVGGGPGYLTFYQDGAPIATKLIPSALGSDFPNDLNLGFVFAILNGAGSSPGTASIKWAQMAQLALALP